MVLRRRVCQKSGVTRVVEGYWRAAESRPSNVMSKAFRAVFELANPYHSVEVRGTAELLPDPEKELPQRLSHRYLGEDPPYEKSEEVRLTLRITPERVNGFAV